HRLAIELHAALASTATTTIAATATIAAAAAAVTATAAVAVTTAAATVIAAAVTATAAAASSAAPTASIGEIGHNQQTTSGHNRSQHKASSHFRNSCHQGVWARMRNTSARGARPWNLARSPNATSALLVRLSA